MIEVSEAWTSQYCKTCNQKGIRKIHGLFQYQTCGEDNADRNAAYNIAKRGLGQASNLGATVNMPKTFRSVDRNTMIRKEVSFFN